MSDTFDKPVLAIDTSLAGCVVGLSAPQTGAFVERVFPTGRDQAAKIVPIVQSVLEEAGLSHSDIGLIVTTIGPGSFTGLRIGMTCAASLALVHNIPLQGVDTMTAMIKSCAADAATDGYLCVLETKRADFYAGLMDANLDWIVPPFSGMADDIAELVRGKSVVLCGDATDRFIEEAKGLSFARIVPRALLSPAALCEAGLSAFLAGGRNPEKPIPMYLREADVSKSTKKQREIEGLPVNF